MDADKARKVNAAIAAAYDAAPYDPPPGPILDPALHTALAALFGLNAAPQDVLDLGCGNGAQLEMVSSRSQGRRVGVDISAGSCALARERFTALGWPADIRCADLLDLGPEELGEFDIIVCIGTLYTLPELVRDKVFELIGRCLRPGGVAIVSYYCGLVGDVEAAIQRVIQAGIDMEADAPARLVQGRRILSELSDAARAANAPAAVLARIDRNLEMEDLDFLHEKLGPVLVSLSTAQINATLSEYGVGLLGHLPGDRTFALPDARARALAREAADLMKGGYRYSVFGKWPSENQAARFDAPGVLWTTRLAPAPHLGENVYRSETPAAQARVDGVSTRAFLAVIAEGGAPWTQALAAAKSLAAQDFPGADFNEAFMKIDLLHLWEIGAVVPTLPGA